ncbi:MmcQ/YjbR family DNA-binding protein [Flexithrix dorotheae]|uniref:MmcQ/YjbR family DNA-binding protein n=1 Tax=Flexithrix dorotheae TaxID=70993 RepID=UPI00036B8D60|nr:MmcQ/YjbR family DNA-binding protein [Flexithrix dorotheae]
MTFESFRSYCLAKKGVTEDYPFKGESVWMKVMGKMFALANVEEFKMGQELVPPFHFINLKCEPEKAIELREKYPAIQPGWHQSKKHWNSLYMDGSLSDVLIKALIDHSYEIVVAGMPKKTQDELKNK